MTLGRKRGIFDVIASLLEILEEGRCNKTTLSTRANLDTRSSKRYIDMLLKFNLVLNQNSHNSFKITDKGKDFLEEYKALKMFIETSDQH